MNAIKINNVTKKYKDFLALNNISLEINKGDFFALLGPNGAGKTTLISCIAGITKITSGTISVLGHDILKYPNKAKKNLGIVPQEIAFDPFFTVLETLRYQSGYFGIKKNDDWIEEILNNIGLLDKINTNTRYLSGGMKRRLMVAQALVHKPEIIILDEPTAGVDIELRKSLWEFIKKLNNLGHTIILTTHYIEEAQELCNKITIMRSGSIIAIDDKKNLLNTDKITLNLKLNKIIPNELKNILISTKPDNEYTLVIPQYNNLKNILDILNKNDIDIIKINFTENKLEDIFLNLINRK